MRVNQLKKRVLRQVLLSTLLCLLATAAGVPVRAYELRAHEWITYRAYLQLKTEGHPIAAELLPTGSGLRRNFLGDYDASDSGTPIDSCDGAEYGTQLLEGAKEEDDACLGVSFRSDDLDALIRSDAHFWLPEGGYGRGILKYNPVSALLKAQYLFQKAQQEYLCNANTELAYWYLGRTVHLLEDMASPAHTHLDSHVTDPHLPGFLEDPDSYEKWCDEINPLTGRPNHEHVEEGPKVDWELLQIYPEMCPPWFDPALSALMYRMAKEGREHDSRDSGQGDGFRSTKDKNRYNSFRHRVRLGHDLKGFPPFIVMLYQQTTGGDIATGKARQLRQGTDYEYDDRTGSDNDALYLYSTVGDAFSGKEDAADTHYDVLELRDSAGRFLATTLERSDRFAVVPSSVMQSDEYMGALIGSAIGNTAAVLRLFWARTHPLFPQLAGRFTCEARGFSAGGALGHSVKSGNGGRVEIRSGVEDVDTGDEHSDLIIPSGTTVSLDSGVHRYRQVLGEGSLEVHGDVTLRCRFGCKLASVRSGPEGANLTIYAGPAIRIFSLAGIDYGLASIHEIADVRLAGPRLFASEDQNSGGEFRFFTSQRGGIELNADVSGGGAGPEHRGGDGGTIVVAASGGSLKGNMAANGGSSGTDPMFGFGWPGGRGGNILIAASAPGELNLSARGGDGGPSFLIETELEPGVDGLDAPGAGSGGAAGQVSARFTAQDATGRINLSTIGGQGGGGDSGQPGAHGLDGTLRAPHGGPGGKGGRGGKGGDGGAPGRIGGFPSSAVIQSRSGNGGSGGYGGRGGSGGKGLAEGGRGGQGGDGGDGGNGGNAGSANAQVGEGGAGGLPGGGGGSKVSPGAAGDAGLPGEPGTLEVVTIYPGSSPPFLVEQCRARRTQPSGRTPILTERGNIAIAFETIPGVSNYIIEASSDLQQWKVITNIVTRAPLFQFSFPSDKQPNVYFRASGSP